MKRTSTAGFEGMKLVATAASSWRTSALGGARGRSCGAGGVLAALWLAGSLGQLPAGGAELPAAADFHKKVEPLLTQYCADCHSGEEKKGGISLDAFKNEADLVSDHELWLKVVKNVRAGLMPPAKKPRPTDGELAVLADWVKYESFGLDAKNPDPGRVTVRRLNRAEYRNTIHDLMGVEFNAEAEFPPDDTGYGFDNIGDVLTLSPMLLEKYLAAAKTIVTEAVPTVSRVTPERVVSGSKFRRTDGKNSPGKNSGNGRDGFIGLNYYEPGAAATTFTADYDGTYRISLELAVRGTFDFDPGRCKIRFKIDDQEVLAKEYGWYDFKIFRFDFERKWTAGDHTFAVAQEPLTPVEDKLNSLEMRINSVSVSGPLEPEHRKHPRNYERFFTRDAPDGAAERQAYARELLRGFTRKAYRHPPEERQVDRLARLAEGVYSQPGKTFEAGIAHALIAVLASPQFLFRLEDNEPGTTPDARTANLDEYALATRLSYFLWSTMPDEELSGLADRHELRKNLDAQVKRMLADSRAEKMIQNFAGQWLQTRDVVGITINARAVLARDDGNEKQMREEQAAFRARFAQGNNPTNRLNATNALALLDGAGRTNVAGSTNQTGRGRGNAPRGQANRFAPPRVELDADLRTAMQRETELFVSSILREDRSITELIDCNYTFLNEKLAKVYGITNVTGTEMRRVPLPPDSPRGGVLTEGSLMVVTSNPDRTSPVKRGLFILDNILGTPAPPPPANVPSLESTEKDFKDHEPTLREVLAVHREKPLCASCHNRMDPIGLAFENFNALGMYREKERNQKIEPQGKLITGETFTSVSELKHLLVNEHRQDFYRCLTEKLLTYALGRGLEYYDLETVDQIVARLNRENGRFSALLQGVVESAPFQKQRLQANPVPAVTPPAAGKKLALN